MHGFTSRVAQAPMLWMIMILVLGLAGVLTTQLVPAPGITFAVSVGVRSVDIRLGAEGAVLRDIDAVGILANLRGAWGTDPVSNNLMDQDSQTPLSQVLLRASHDGAAKMETLLIQGAGRMNLAYRAREHSLDIRVVEDAGAQISFGWEGQVDVRVPEWLSGQGAQSVILPSGEIDVALDAPQMPASLSAPFRVRGIRLEVIDDNAFQAYAVSTITDGHLQFFSYGVPLTERMLHPGTLLRFDGLDATVTNLTGDTTALRLQLHGRADDVQLGYGSVLSSIHPSAFESLGALSSVRVALSTLLGALLSLIGVAGIGAKTVGPPEDAEPDAIAVALTESKPEGAFEVAEAALVEDAMITTPERGENER
ncbi:MAG: hypothetical protein P1V13_13730 [Rhizobiaceae bacterium]|nr:hypothetical protein [Rhizobiaceae bacterium]